MPRITQAQYAYAIQQSTDLRIELEGARREATAAQESLQEKLAKLEAELHERDESLAREQGDWVVTKQGLEKSLEEAQEELHDLRDDNQVIGHRLQNQQEAIRAQCIVVVLLLSGFLTSFAVLAGLRCDLGPEL